MMKNVKLTVIAEDSLSTSKKALGLEAKHGLSILVEGSKPKFSILMDTGQSPNILLHNMEILGVSLEKIDAVFLSHGHYDHTGGLLGVLKKINRNVPIIAHPDVFKPKFKLDPNLKYIGSPFKQSEQFSRGIIVAKNSVTIAEGVMSTGEIERVTPYEKPQGFWTVENERFVEDLMRDDQAIILNIEEKGLVVISGCAHAGIVNTVKHAQKITGISRVHAIIGGFHLKDSKDETIEATTRDLAEMNPNFIYPCHCTGAKPISQLTELFKERCQPIRTGDIFKI